MAIWTASGPRRTTLGQVGAQAAQLAHALRELGVTGDERVATLMWNNLLMGHPAVLEACVVGVPDECWGERPFATVVVRPGSAVTAADLHAHLAASLARWQLPERWAFIEAVPRTSVGKFDKKVVRSRYAEGAYTVQTPA